MWNKFKVDTTSFSSLSLNSALHRTEKDKSEHDTVLSRALLRYYEDDIPQWLEAARASSDAPSMRIPKPSLGSTSQPAAVSRTSLDFLNKSRQSPVPRENPITALTQGLPTSKTSRGRLGEKLRGSNW